MRSVIDRIRKNAPSFGSIPFWSWNDRLKSEELRRQMRDMKRIGMAGCFMHARAGLETEYLSDEWFECVNACVDEAERLGMQAWAYDENGWPSGFGGGRLLEDRRNLAIGLEQRRSGYPDADDDLVIAVYTRNADGTFTRVTHDIGADEYLILLRKYDESYVDTLNPEVTKKFIACTHEEYKRRVPHDKFGAGKPMPGFFTDEPQYCRWGSPYSDVLPEKFREEYGYDVFDALPAIFWDYPGADKHRYDYYYLVHKLFITSFIEPVYNWCKENGAELTGHAVEEVSLSTQMWCCGGCMPFYEYETIPGIDYLGREIQGDLAYKQLGSACAQLGKTKVLSEMFACCGWDVTPLELKKIADVQYAGGVNLMCQHLYPYSERGQRKRDYPLHYSEHNPWQEYLTDFNRHYANLGAILSEGEEYAPVLVIHPMHSAYCRYMRNDEARISDLDSKLAALVDPLGENQVPYHFGDEWMMARMARVDGDRLIVGRMSYSAVLVPYLYSLDSSTAELLREFSENGGKICLTDGVPMYIDGAPRGAHLDFLRSSATMDDIFALRDALITAGGRNIAGVRKMTRRTDDGAIMFLTNVGDDDISSAEVKLPEGRWAELDVDSLELRPICEKNRTAHLRFKSGESHVLVSVSEEEYSSLGSVGLPRRGSAAIAVPREVRLAEPVDNVLTLDFAARSNDGVNYDDPMSVMGIKDNLLRERYAGRVWLKFKYEIGAGYVPRRLRLAIEPMYARVTVNGVEIRPDEDNWWFDRHTATADIAPLTHEGVNEVIVEVEHYQRDYVYHVLYDGLSEASRNCLLFDTEIENIYLIGDFGVRSRNGFRAGKGKAVLTDGGFVLGAQPAVIPSDDAVRGGFPFYGGRLICEFDYNYTRGMPTLLRADGRHAAAAVSVNGIDIGTMLFDDELDIGDYLREGANTISVEICNSMRNAMGPHHRREDEILCVGPQHFSFEGEWNGRECEDFDERYSFIKFGIVK